MPRTDHFAERIGSVQIPEAAPVDPGQDALRELPIPLPEPGPRPFPPGPTPELPRIPPILREPFPEIPQIPELRLPCFTTLRDGCYILGFVPDNTPIFGTRYQGTMRLDRVGNRVRFSGDLYRWRLLEDIVIQPDKLRPIDIERAARQLEGTDAAADIPVHRRRRYHSYLQGTGATFLSLRPPGGKCRFTLRFAEWVYNHPATGFNGSFDTAATRNLRFSMQPGDTPDTYTGDVYDGTTHIGTASLRWVSQRFRRATLRLHTLQGAVAPPANVAGATFASIFADAGYELTFVDGGTVQLPQGLSGTNVNACWSMDDLHELMQSVPGYDSAVLDREWRVELVAVPATLGCGRGVMFDSSIGADPNAIAREGTATFSHDGYPAGDAPAPGGGSHYDAAANGQQRNFPRAFLRSATHEVGHAFNQIHQNFEGGLDNSIMSPTPSVAQVIGAAGTFPDDINLVFNDTVRGHLRHLPDPAVRPGAMDFFGSAISAPQAADVLWPDDADLTVEVSSARVALGEVLSVTYRLTNRGEGALTAPEKLDVEALTVRINVTDPAGWITFMRPPKLKSCPNLGLQALESGASIEGSTDVFWGKDGFAFETPGRHEIEVIVLYYVSGIPVAAAATQSVFVSHPTSDVDNDVAAALLRPDIGEAVAIGDADRIRAALGPLAEGSEAGDADARGIAPTASHPAVQALRARGLLDGGASG